MKIDSINKALDGIIKTVNEIKYSLLLNPQGIQITVIYQDDLSLVEYWDGNQTAILIGLCPEKIPFNVLTYWLNQALGMIPISSIDKEDAIVQCDLRKEEWPDDIHTALEVLSVTYQDVVDPSYVKLLEEKYAIDDYRKKYSSEQKAS